LNKLACGANPNQIRRLTGANDRLLSMEKEAQIDMAG
jgi:hypothetical protein